MLIGEIIGAVMIAALAVGIVTRRRAHDDVHSVEHYHRQIHTLEGMSAHPAGSGTDGGDKPANSESAFRLTGSRTVRLTDPGKPDVPPVAPPAVADLSEPVKCDDAGPHVIVSGSALSGRQDRVMDAINRRPRRLAAPSAAVAAVAVLIIILLVTGSHNVAPRHHQKSPSASHARTHVTAPATRHQHATTTTVPPLVSLPTLVSAQGATYAVGISSYSLVLSATSSSCWVDATDTNTGSILFTGVLTAGQAHTVTATGAVSVVSGAPAFFSATVNGSTVALPVGFQAPFTLHFVPATTPT